MKIVITTHGDLCEGLLNSYQMIAGDISQFITVKLDEKGISNYSERLNTRLTTLLETDQILILCDIAGGTPYNESYRFALTHPNKVHIVTGVNLPMLIEVGFMSEPNIQEAAKMALNAGQSGISISEYDEQNLNNEDDLAF